LINPKTKIEKVIATGSDILPGINKKESIRYTTSPERKGMPKTITELLS
jgi:hypothetical protein